MALNLNQMSEGGQGFDIPELKKDSYIARLVSIIDLGNQMKTDWKTGDPEMKNGKPVYSDRGVFVFEIPSEKYVEEYEKEQEDGTKTQEKFEFIRRVFKEVSFTTGENSGLMTLLTDLDLIDTVQQNKGEISTILNTPVMVTTDHTASGNPKIKSVTKVPSIAAGQIDSCVAESEQFAFTMDDGSEKMQHVFNELLGDNFRGRIQEARNWEGSALEKALSAVEGSGDAEADANTNALLG